MFPPGRARLATNAFATGSLSCVMTIGIVAVAFLAGPVAPKPPVTMISTLRRTSSAASAGRLSSFPSADRRSMTMVFPSTYPRSRSPCWNASMRAEKAEKELAARYPIRGMFFACCASANEAVDSRAAITRQMIIFVFIVSALRLSNYLVRPRQHVGRDCESDLLGGFEIDYKFEPRPLFDGYVCWLGTFENLVHVNGEPPKGVGDVSPVAHQTANFAPFSARVHRWDFSLCRKLNNLFRIRCNWRRPNKRTTPDFHFQGPINGELLHRG